jgi:hypothetical protein
VNCFHFLNNILDCIIPYTIRLTRLGTALAGSARRVFGTKRVNDAEPAFQLYAILHIFGPERVAIACGAEVVAIIVP